ncbi:class A beta-lactamase-related serine hydrolase [Mycolicibacterium moriokaense]|nr:class A beta-lactamase-related serine hydrolase [Mycolicibacterium moriokaense]
MTEEIFVRSQTPGDGRRLRLVPPLFAPEDAHLAGPGNPLLPQGVSGACDPHFSSAVKAFAKLFPGPGYGGGALAVYLHGRPVVDVWTGFADREGTQPWTADTGALAFSSTKGLTSTVVHRLVDRGLLSYDEPVAAFWPDFGANGKSDLTVRDILAHRAGLSRMRDITVTELLDTHLMEGRLAAARADHLVGKSAYHALTYGWLLSGLVRAVTGHGMRRLFRSELAEPLNTDGIHLGRPPLSAPTTAAQTLLPQGPATNSLFDFAAPKLAILPLSGMLQALHVPGVLGLLQGEMQFLDAEIPSANGVLTARAVARMYGAIANGGRIDDRQFLSNDVARGLAGRRSYRPDANVVVPMSFHLGYHATSIPGLLPGFGHSGLGGSVGWADPKTGASFAFIHNRFITRKVLDQASFAGLSPLLRRAVANATKHGVTCAVGDFGAEAISLQHEL